jgi:hypothetical protein
MRNLAVLVSLLIGTAIAAADPGAVPLPDPPPPRRAVRSLREEATRVATELVDVHSSRDPDLLLMPWRIERWSADGRAGQLEGGAAAATLVGELILGLGGAPIAALAAAAAGATLDVAAADAEAASEPAPVAKPRVKHRLGRGF